MGACCSGQRYHLHLHNEHDNEGTTLRIASSLPNPSSDVSAFDENVTEIRYPATDGDASVQKTSGTVTAVGSGFTGFSLLTTINLRGLTNCTSIADHFASNCPSLEALDLSDLPLTSIPDGFALKCTSLKSVNLSALIS